MSKRTATLAGLFSLTLILLAGLQSAVRAANGPATRLLRSPSVSATHIAFAYANNVWTVERAGGSARRITSFQGLTSNPHFSPDGKWLAFSAEYAGNIDVYVVPSEGGEPKRLTWHPGQTPCKGGPPMANRPLYFHARHIGAQRRAAILDGAGRRRRGNADGVAARLSRQDLRRRLAHRLPHEQLLGRGAP